MSALLSRTTTLQAQQRRQLCTPACGFVSAPLVPSTSAQQQPARNVTASAGKGFGAAKPQKQVRAPVEQAPPPMPCVCDSGKAYKNCCEHFHTNTAAAPTPEATLRARFSAFIKGDLQYLLDTTHSDYYPYHYNKPKSEETEEQLRADLTAGINKFTYTGLKVIENEPGSHEDEGFVAFEYLSVKKGEEKNENWDRTAEKCRFLRVNGVWQFVDYQRATFEANRVTPV